MVAYLDSSVVLRHILLGEASIRHALAFPRVVASELIEIECRRVLHRCRLAGELDDETLAAAHQRLDAVLAGIDLLEMSMQIKQRAMEPFPGARAHPRRAACRDRARGRRGGRWDSAVLARQGHEPVRQVPRAHGSPGVASRQPVSFPMGYLSYVIPYATDCSG